MIHKNTKLLNGLKIIEEAKRQGLDLARLSRNETQLFLNTAIKLMADGLPVYRAVWESYESIS